MDAGTVGDRKLILASDGEIGHVEDFLMDDTDWSIHYLIVDTKNWWPGKKVLISPRSAREIDWNEKLVHLDVDRQKVKASPEYDASTRSIGPMRSISMATTARSSRAIGPCGPKSQRAAPGVDSNAHKTNHARLMKANFD